MSGFVLTTAFWSSQGSLKYYRSGTDLSKKNNNVEFHHWVASSSRGLCRGCDDQVLFAVVTWRYSSTQKMLHPKRLYLP